MLGEGEERRDGEERWRDGEERCKRKIGGRMA